MQNCVHYSCLVGQFISDLRNCALSCFITQMNLNAVKLLFFKCPAFYKRFRWGGWMLSMWKKYKWRRRKRSDLWLIDFLAGSESYRKCSSCYDILLSLVLPALVLFCGFNFFFYVRKCYSCYEILLSLVLPALFLFCGGVFVFLFVRKCNSCCNIVL